MRLFSLFLLLSIGYNVSAQRPYWAEIKKTNGKPSLYVNGELTVPDFYALTHAYGARWSWEEVPQRNLKNFTNIGFKLFQLDLYFEDIWYKGAPELDISKAQHQVRGLLDVCPDAAVVIRVHVNAPFGWNEENRDECVEFANGPIDQRQYGPPFNNEDGDTDRPLRASLASVKWRVESGDKLKEFCSRMALTPEGEHVIGIHVSGGVYGEWHNWGFIANDPDSGKAMTVYFRNWLKKKYQTNKALQKAWKSTAFSLNNATVPDTMERNYTADGIFRDPQKEQRIIDYYTAQHEVVAEDIEYFTKIVKDNWPRPLIVGVFYGYFHMTFCRQAAGGHLFIERILNCPTIDYLSAPQSYWGAAQNLGGSGNSRAVIESAMLHGKLWLDELDNGHLQKKTTIDPVRISGKYDPNYVPVLQRSAIYPLMRGIGLWYYDFGPRESFGWWDNPVYLKSIEEERAFFEQHKFDRYKSVADVLMVWDQEVFYYTKNSWTPIGYNLLDQAFEEALRAGAATDQVYLFDLDKVNLDQYKVILFMNVFKMNAEQRKFIREKVAQSGRTLVWNYLPGYTNGEKNELNFVNELTGFGIESYSSTEAPKISVPSLKIEYELEAPVIPMVVINDKNAEQLAMLKLGNEVIVGRKHFQNYTSLYSTLPLHDSDFFRAIFKTAGCHIYSNSNDFTYANSGFIMLHCKAGGLKTIHLLTGKTISIELNGPSTLLLDATSGVAVLK